MKKLALLAAFSVAAASAQANLIMSYGWEDGVFTELGTLGDSSIAFGMNEVGQVVGRSLAALPDGSLGLRGFIWEDGEMTGLVEEAHVATYAAAQIQHRTTLGGCGLPQKERDTCPCLHLITMRIQGQIGVPEPVPEPLCRRGHVPLWYGWPRMIVPARYSCSASTSRAISCVSVMDERDTRSPARASTCSDRPWAPPMRMATPAWP